MKEDNLKIACILDTFSYDCLKYECNLLYLSKDSWLNQIIDFQPDLLFIEAFWEGKDQSWRAEIVNLKSTADSEILKLINYCKSYNIKTVFWNKEDPPNYDVFIDVAIHFDFIFTTDRYSMEKYSKIVGENRVFLLPFAAQPEIHNPIGKGTNGKVAFAGSWYDKKHFLRQHEMEYVLDGVLELDNLDIFDRNYKNKIKNFPEKYSKYVNGGLDYVEMVQKYKEYNVFLNVNIVFYSETMFSRRVFEILASGTNIVSSYALGIQNYFADLVPMSNTKEGINKWVRLLLNDVHFSKSLSILGVREIFEKHLYEHRMKYLLECIGIKQINKDEKKVLIIVKLSTVDNINMVVENFKRQVYKNKKLIIIHNIKVDLKPYINIDYKEYVDIQMFLNSVEGDVYLAVMSELSYYGPEYLTDFIHATKYTKSPIIGKSNYYTYSNSDEYRDAGRENNYVDFSQLNCNTIFIKIRGLENSIILDILNKNDLNLPVKCCYSINMFEFANVYVSHSSINENINIDKIQLEQLNISVEDYKKQLSTKLYSKDYLGFNKLLKKQIKDYNAPIVIYASGEHTKKVLKIIDRNQFNIIGLTDSNETLFDKNKFGLLIESIDYWKEKGMEYIYISSKEYETEIYSKLKDNPILDTINIINLYTLNEKYKEDLFKEIYSEDINS